MGLDMYLNKKIYVSHHDWEENGPNSDLKITGLEGWSKGETVAVDPKRVKYIIEQVGYWRKANAIHAWFVKNIQEGKDECQESYVSQEQMKELLETVNKVLESIELVPAKINAGTVFKGGVREELFEDGETVKDYSLAHALLPVQEGFFFGGKDYDQWYVADLKTTKAILEEAVKDEQGEYYYQASW